MEGRIRDSCERNAVPSELIAKTPQELGFTNNVPVKEFLARCAENGLSLLPAEEMIQLEEGSRAYCGMTYLLSGPLQGPNASEPFIVRRFEEGRCEDFFVVNLPEIYPSWKVPLLWTFLLRITPLENGRQESWE